MNIHHHDETTKVIHGDCIETMNAMSPESVDAIVTDPPYGLGFMGKKWDGLPPSQEWAEACYRVLKPGGHIAAFGGTRTWHRLAVAIEDAGFEMRDSLAWLYGSGSPKSMNVSKAIVKAAGVEGAYDAPKSAAHAAHIGKGDYSTDEKNAGWERPWMHDADAIDRSARIYEGGSEDSRRWTGWGTALKPAFEPIVLARKPLAEKTVARNVLTHGTGAINVDACRIEGEADRPMPRAPQGGILRLDGCHSEAELRALAEVGGKTPNGRDARATLVRAIADRERYESSGEKATNTGRWPANVLLDQHAAAWVDEQSGTSKSNVRVSEDKDEAGATFALGRSGVTPRGHTDSGGASRFFYTAKAPKTERPNVDGVQHPTVKPLAIMEWLIRLVTPPGGTVLDPFAGSGTTLEAARKLGHKSIGIEAEETYLPLIDQRLQRSNTNPIELEGIGE